jgi:hypothetical protein
VVAGAAVVAAWLLAGGVVVVWVVAVEDPAVVARTEWCCVRSHVGPERVVVAGGTVFELRKLWCAVLGLNQFP